VTDNNDNLTVPQAIALAQGLNATASSRNARIIRRSGGQLREIPAELKLMMAAKSPDIALVDEDVFFRSK
jgi:protein involved in polysaccharide export with SLBB domain